MKSRANSQDGHTGFLFLAVGLCFGAKTLLDLDIGSPAEMGPGFFPLALCILLVAIGCGVLVKARADEEDQPPINWRAVLLIGAAPVAFGLTVRSLGLVPALVIGVGMAVLSARFGLARSAAIVVGVTLFCVAIFKFGVGVPYDLFNPALWR